MRETKICPVCGTTFERPASTGRARNDGWDMRKSCYAPQCHAELRRMRDRTRRTQPSPAKVSVDQLYGGRRYEDVRSAR